MPTSPWSSAVSAGGKRQSVGGGSGGTVPFYRVPGRLPAVVVEAAPGLPAEVAGRHHAPQAGDRRVVRVAELVVEGVEDRGGGVEPDQVEQGQRAHREVAAALHGG